MRIYVHKHTLTINWLSIWTVLGSIVAGTIINQQLGDVILLLVLLLSLQPWTSQDEFIHAFGSE